MNQTKNRNDFIVAIAMAVMTLLPMIGIGNIIRMIIAAALFIKLIIFGNVQWNSVLKMIIIGMLTNLFAACALTLLIENSINSKFFIKELQRFIFYIVIFVVLYNSKINFESIYWISAILLVIHLTIQILEWNGDKWVFDFIRNNYIDPSDTTMHHLSLAYINDSGFRSGSVFINPNVYMPIPLCMLGLFLQAKIQGRKIFLNTFFICVTLVSMFYTGSRTTVIVAGVELIVFLFLFNKSKKMLLLVIAGVALILYFGSSLVNSRVFAVSDGMDDSLGIKLGLLLRYLLGTNPIHFLLGIVASPSVNFGYGIDMEWGNIIAEYGFLSLLWYINVYRAMRRNSKQMPFLSTSLNINMALIGLSASVFLCMPIFPYFCLLGLPEIYIKDRLLIDNEGLK